MSASLSLRLVDENGATVLDLEASSDDVWTLNALLREVNDATSAHLESRDDTKSTYVATGGKA